MKARKNHHSGRGAGPDNEHLLADVRQALAQGRPDRAQQLCRQILDSGRREAEALHLMGLACGQSGRYDQAVERIREAVRLRPDHAVAHTNLAVALRALGRNADALEHSAVAVGLAPQSLHAVMYHATLLSESESWAEAARWAERWVLLDANNAAAHRMLGDAYSRQGLRQRAAAPYAKSLALEPDSMEVANNLGACLAAEGQRAEALAVLCHAAERHPENAAAWANLGVAAKSLGDVNTAMQCLDRALQLEAGACERAMEPVALPAGEGTAGGGLGRIRMALESQRALPGAAVPSTALGWTRPCGQNHPGVVGAGTGGPIPVCEHAAGSRARRRTLHRGV